MPTFPYGLSIAMRIIGYTGGSLGYILQRKSHLRNDSVPVSKRRDSIHRPLWWTGFLIYLGASLVGDVFSVSSLPIIVIAPLAAFSLLFNALFAHFLLHEKMNRYAVLSTIVIAISSTVIVILFNREHKQNTIEDIHALLSKWIFDVYLIGNIVVIAVLWIMIYHSSVFANKKIKSIVYQIISTILATKALIFAKLSYDLVVASIDEKTKFVNPVSLIVLATAIVTIVLQIYTLNKSLRYCSTIITIPIGYSLGIILSSINALLYYETFLHMNAWTIVAVLFCIVLIIVSIFVLCVWGNCIPNKSQEDDNDDGEIIHLDSPE